MHSGFETGMSLCIDGKEFGEAVNRDIRSAKDRVLVQTLSFEGDRAGTALTEALLASPAGDKRIIVDSYTNHVISDRFVHSPSAFFDRPLQDEVRETRRMMERLRRRGVAVQFVRPLGIAFHRILGRDHRKSVLIDDAVAYIGGINFSDHNFDWHDLMLRISDRSVTSFLHQDFLSTWSGCEKPSFGRFEGVELHIADGRDNESMLVAVSERIDQAKRSIYMECPYVTEPFYSLLQGARRRGVEVTILTSKTNNRPFMKSSITEACMRFGFRLRLCCQRMTHLKAMLIDDDCLILGSTNFDCVSFKTQAEILAIVSDRRLIAEFKERVQEPDLQSSVEWDSSQSNGLSRRLGYEVLKIVDPLNLLLLKGPSCLSASTTSVE